MRGDVNNGMGLGSADDQEPTSGGFLSQDEIEQQIAAFRTSMRNLDQDPAEETRIDMLITGASAMFGDDLTPFEDPPAAGRVQKEKQAPASETGAPPRIEVAPSGPGLKLVIYGDHAEPHVHVTANQPAEDLRLLLDKHVALLLEAKTSPRHRTSGRRSSRKDPATRRLSLSAPVMLAVAGSIAAILVHSAVVVQVIAIAVLGALPAFYLAAAAAAIFSSRPDRRRAAFDVLKLLMEREDPPGAARRETPALSDRRSGERAGR